MLLFAQNVSDLCVAHACASVLVSVYMHCVFVYVCVFLWEPCWSALAKQRSVQYRSDVGWADLTEPRPSTNPGVFRSPGPYLMSLCKKRSSSFSRSLFPLSFFHSLSLFLMHPLSIPSPAWSQCANEWVPSVYSAVLSLPLSSFTSLSLSFLTDIAEVDTKLNSKHLFQHEK